MANFCKRVRKHRRGGRNCGYSPDWIVRGGILMRRFEDTVRLRRIMVLWGRLQGGRLQATCCPPTLERRQASQPTPTDADRNSAKFGVYVRSDPRLFSGVKRTSRSRAVMSADDPRTDIGLLGPR